jgi:diguanylate cyclase (GGDEF)-like protein
MKPAKLLYRLTMPGGLVLLTAFLLIRMGIINEVESRHAQLYPDIIFGVGVLLCAVFRRSRLFFAFVMIALSYGALVWLTPHIPADAQRVLLHSIAVLIPLNLMGYSLLRDRGVISPAGERRLAFICIQAMAVCALTLPKFARAAALLDRDFFPRRFSEWSRLPQPALVAFVLVVLVMSALLARRYGTVESSLLWSVVSLFVALRAGAGTLVGAVYFSAAGLVLVIAVLETSYSMAYHDELTQLPSRRALNEDLLKLGDSYTIAMLDVDHFKNFNDTYGHEAGDQALRMVASRLAHVTGGGKAYRYGGEEFAVIFPGKPAEEAFTYLDRMRRWIEQSTFIVRGQDRRKSGKGKKSRHGKTETNVTISVGIAARNGTSVTVDQVMRSADKALYKAKAKGRNCTVVAKPPKPAAEVGMRVLQVE